jgi:hypothetical protein
MNTALTVALWVSVGVCVIGIGLVSCWLLLDWQHEAQQARAVARMVRSYGGGSAEDSAFQRVDEFTWPIVAQQPQRFYSRAITIPIPRCVLNVELQVQRPEPEEPADLQWPVVDVDLLAAGGSHLKTDVLPVIYDELSHKAS